MSSETKFWIVVGGLGAGLIALAYYLAMRRRSASSVAAAPVDAAAYVANKYRAAAPVNGTTTRSANPADNAVAALAPGAGSSSVPPEGPMSAPYQDSGGGVEGVNMSVSGASLTEYPAGALTSGG